MGTSWEKVLGEKKFREISGLRTLSSVCQCNILEGSAAAGDTLLGVVFIKLRNEDYRDT